MKDVYKLIDIYEIKIKDKIYYKAFVYDKNNHVCLDLFIDKEAYDYLINECYIDNYIDDYIKLRYNHKEKKYQIYISVI